MNSHVVVVVGIVSVSVDVAVSRVGVTRLYADVHPVLECSFKIVY